jgi:transcriptional regulator with XRE-family HTH domain
MTQARPVRRPKDKSISAFLAQLREERPELKRAWDEGALARGIALTLVRLRRDANLTQGQVAARANWDKAHVSRLESASNGVPDLATVVRYASACGGTISLVAVRPAAEGTRIISALPLAETEAEQNDRAFVEAAQDSMLEWAEAQSAPAAAQLEEE